MGIRESRISFFPYEEVQKRVSGDELKRLRMAFKRLAGASGVMSKTLFLREVLGESVPLKLAEQIYLAFGGTSKGIYFKDLVCGIALLTRGSLLDRLKFIFEVYSNDGSQVLRDDMESLLYASEGGKIPEEIMQNMFATTDRLSSQEFCEWLRRNPDSITLSKWLVYQGNGLQLTDYGDTPTFYQTIAKFTGLQELDIIELEKKYWYLKSGTKTGKFDMETFTPLISSCVPDSLSQALFNAFDENQDGHIDFREIACGISTCCRGPIAERFAFTFKIFDQDRDGLLSEQEILAMIKVMVGLKSENVPHSPMGEEVPEINPTMLVGEIFNDYDSDKDGFITLEEYKKWATTHSLSRLVLEILFQICHVIFGLRPATRKDEYQVIWGWLDRENFRGLIPGTTWYLIAMDWWKKWKEFVGCQKSLMARSLSTSALERNGVGPLSSSLSSTTSHAWDKIESTMKKTLVTRRASQPLRSVAPLVGVNGHVPNGIMSKPGTINNSFLVEQDARKIQSLTGDGGKLKCTIPLVRGRDFEIVPEHVWKALVQWYTGSPALPRNVIIPTDGDPTPVLELFPRLLLLYRHAQPPAKSSFQSWSGMGFGLNGLHFSSSTASTAASVVTPRRQLTYTAVFSRMNTLQQLFDFLCQRLRLKGEDIRLWNMADENNLQLLDEDQFGQTLEESSIEDQHPILIEIRNRDMSWPEEMTSLALNKAFQDKRPHGKGMTGLSNLGNTCFMNSAIQCMSNTTPLTSYFTDGYHLYELNKVNPLGMKGNIAKRYGEVVQDLWGTSCRSIAPLKLRWTIGRYAPRFNGFQQQDSQEFLAFLLDGLHEDLNRVHSKPYVELKDSDGRPDEEVAKEAWDNHLKRNKSIVVDLFQGQLKSCVRCLQCNHVSVRFDPYTFLSLPIPMDNSIYVECIVVTLNGVVPIKYGLLLSTDDKYKKLKKQLAKLCGLTPAQLLMVEVIGATIKSQPFDSQKVRSSLSGILYAFEVPPSPAVENTTSCTVAVATSSEATMDVHVGNNAPAGTPVGEGTTITTEPTTKDAEQPREVRTTRTQLVRSPSRSSSEKSLGGSLKLPCLSRQTSDDDDDEESIEVASEVSGRSNVGLLRQLSPRFIRAFGHKKSGSSWNGSESSGVTSVLRDQSTMSSTKTTPCHSRNTSMSSSSGTPVHAGGSQVFDKARSYVVGMHRKLMRMDVYFVAPQKNRPSLFGCPLIIPCIAGTKNSQLYSAVWQQVSRFVSAPAPGEDVTDNRDTGCPFEYPFELKAVSEGGLSCAVCPWYKFCRGCTVECNDEEFNCNCYCIAIEWEPTTLHLRYQSSQEKVFTEHESVERSRRLQTEPIDLYECFKAFTKEEELGEDELWYCSKCKKHQLASKKLDIWSLPPILIIHLKRFQFMNGRWVKSNKVVNFPMKHFDPSEFVVKRPTCGGYDSGEDGTCVRTVNVKTVDKVARDRECCSQILMETTSDKDPVSVTDASLHKGSSDSGLSSNSSGCCSDESHVSKNDSDEPNEDSGYSSQSSLQTGAHQRKHSGKVHPVVSNETSSKLPEELVTVNISKDTGRESSVERCETGVPVCDECLLNEPCDCSTTSSKASDMNCVGINSVDLFDVASVTSTRDVLPVLKLESGVEQESGLPQMLYNLYTISSHAGVMGGGHYVSFSKNPNGKWYCFNDSSCKETTSERVQKESPYLLFFERVRMDYTNFLPDVKDRTPESNDEDEIDNEFKKACVLQ